VLSLPKRKADAIKEEKAFMFDGADLFDSGMQLLSYG
jgi:hypothetical protein